MLPTYCDFVNRVTTLGEPVSPRGFGTREILGTEFSYDPRYVFYRPKFNLQLAWAELMMMVAGVYNPNVIKYAAPSADLSLYHRDLMYGPIIINQMESVLNLLVRDRDTREAILVIGNRSPVEMWRQPCTTSIQFLIRQGLLITIVSMRSQDLVLGLPYDLVMFGGLAQVVATELGLSLGNVTIHQGSAHVYDSTAPMVPIEHQWMSYAIQYGFFRACSEWRRELVEMCWKPAPSGITHTCWFKKDDTWIAEVA